MKKKTTLVLIAAAVILAGVILAVVLLGGGDDAKASAMWLVKTEGTVSVADKEGEDVPIKSMMGMELRLGLYDGYSVGTESASYGWIDLDDTKLTKLDEDSEVKVNRAGRELELVVSRGSLFFNITKPLEDDETLEIRSSSMVMAVRGTSGWVRVLDDETFDVYIIDGKVRCSVRTQDSMIPTVEQVSAGQTARLSVSGGAPSITVDTFDEADVPDFVAQEVREDEELQRDMAAIGIDLGGGQDSPENPGGQTGGYGDVSGRIETLRPELTHDLPDVYFELPVLSGSAAGIPAINSFFREMADEFLAGFSGTDAYIDSAGGPDEDGFTEYYKTEVSIPFEGAIGVTMSYSMWNSMSTHPFFYNISYLFDLETGKQFTLRDVVDGTDEEILELLRAGFSEDETVGTLVDDRFMAMLDLDKLSFTIEGDTVKVSANVVGNFSATASLPLSARLGGPGSDGDGTARQEADVSDQGWSVSGGVLTLTARYERANPGNWDSDPWREYKNEVTKIVVEEGVTSLPNGAFDGFGALEEVSLPEGLVSIGNRVFGFCTKLRSVNLPESLAGIGHAAFTNCYALESVTIPENVTEIGSSVFYNCISLVRADVLGPVMRLDGTFYRCLKLSSVTLPEGLLSLDGTFYDCESLTQVDLPSTLLWIEDRTFRCSGLVTLTVPEGVTYIGEYIFDDCGALETVWLPSTLTDIAKSALKSSSLKTIYFAGTQEQWERISAESGLSDSVDVIFGG